MAYCSRTPALSSYRRNLGTSPLTSYPYRVRADFQGETVDLPDAAPIARLTILAVCVSFLVSIASGQDSQQPDSLNARLLGAAQTGDTLAVRQLLKQGADLEARDERGWTALARAANCGHAETVKLLLAKGADPQAGQIVGDEVLADAATIGNANKVKLLLDFGAEHKAINEAMMAAASSTPPLEIRVSADAGNEGSTDPKPQPSTMCPLFDYGAVARLLLDGGADVRARDESGGTLLIDAAGHGNTAMVKVLLERNLEVEAVDDHGDTALLAAACNCAVATMPSTLGAMKLLLKKGADVEAKNSEGFTALMTAAVWGRTDNVRLLLDSGAKVDDRDSQGNTALLATIDSVVDALEAIKLLLESGADIEARNNNGDTALLLAAKAQAERIDIVKLLLSKGANIQVRDKQGQTALQLAAENAHSATVSLLTNWRENSP